MTEDKVLNLYANCYFYFFGKNNVENVTSSDSAVVMHFEFLMAEGKIWIYSRPFLYV